MGLRERYELSLSLNEEVWVKSQPKLNSIHFECTTKKRLVSIINAAELGLEKSVRDK